MCGPVERKGREEERASPACVQTAKAGSELGTEGAGLALKILSEDRVCSCCRVCYICSLCVCHGLLCDCGLSVQLGNFSII